MVIGVGVNIKVGGLRCEVPGGARQQHADGPGSQVDGGLTDFDADRYCAEGVSGVATRCPR